MLDIDNLLRHVEAGNINVKKHPKHEFWVYDYSRTVQYDKLWDNETTQARGLVLDAKYEVIAKPIPKFFNHSEFSPEELEKFFEFSYTATEKLDGSCLIVRRVDDDTVLYTTRGSFESDQAKEGEKIIRENGWEEFLSCAYTYIFEVIYPENRIVVDYKGLRTVVLLAMYDMVTLTEVPFSDIKAATFPWPVTQEVRTSYSDLIWIDTPNLEGFVLCNASGTRMKVKMPTYCKLHRIMTDITPKKIFDMMVEGVCIEDMLKDTPDEFNEEIRDIIRDIDARYNRIRRQAEKDLLEAVKYMNATETGRKGLAEYLFKNAWYPHVSFAIHDGYNLDKSIYTQIKMELK